MLRRLTFSFPALVAAAFASLAAISVIGLSEDAGLKLAWLGFMLAVPLIWFVLTKRGPLVAYALLGHAVCWVFLRFLAPFDPLADWAAVPTVVHELDCLIAATGFILLGCTIAHPSLWKISPRASTFEGPTLDRPALLALGFTLAWIPFADSLPKMWDGPYQAAWPLALALLYTARSPGHSRLVVGLKIFGAAMAILTFVRLGTLKVVLSLGLIECAIALLRPSLGRAFRLALLVGLVGLFQSVKHEFRTGAPQAQSESVMNQIDRLGGLLRQTVFSHWLRQGLQRAHDSSLEAALAQTPSQVPFWEGETYGDLWVIPIPRLIWKDKPSWRLWHEFGHRYHILEPKDPQTSVQIGYLAEGYANFGYPGLWLAALIFGLFLGVADRWVSSRPPGENLFVFMLFTRIFFIPADAFTIVSQLYQTLILLTLFLAAVNFRDHFRKLNPALS